MFLRVLISSTTFVTEQNIENNVLLKKSANNIAKKHGKKLQKPITKSNLEKTNNSEKQNCAKKKKKL